jgi:hypothetical protein
LITDPEFRNPDGSFSQELWAKHLADAQKGTDKAPQWTALQEAWIRVLSRVIYVANWIETAEYNIGMWPGKKPPWEQPYWLKTFLESFWQGEAAGREKRPKG